MKYKDLNLGDIFYNKDKDTLCIKTLEFVETNNDKFVWNSIVISSTVKNVDFHKGKGAWYSDDAEVIRVKMGDIKDE